MGHFRVNTHLFHWVNDFWQLDIVQVLQSTRPVTACKCMAAELEIIQCVTVWHETTKSSCSLKLTSSGSPWAAHVSSWTCSLWSSCRSVAPCTTDALLSLLQRKWKWSKSRLQGCFTIIWKEWSHYGLKFKKPQTTYTRNSPLLTFFKSVETDQLDCNLLVLSHVMNCLFYQLFLWIVPFR